MTKQLLSFLFLFVTFFFCCQAQTPILYGTTFNGGNGNGSIFAYNTITDTETTVHSFSSNPNTPYGSLIQASNKLLYGLTKDGGDAGFGTIFSYNTITGTETTLYSIGDNINDGAFPLGSLMQASNGLLYGMTSLGGGYSSGENMDSGIIFSYDISTGLEKVLHSFGGNGDGTYPTGSLIQATDSLLYGMTSQGGTFGTGTIFSYNISTGTETILHNFGSGSPTDGTLPYGSLIQASNGLLYGLTSRNGAYGGGVIFSYNISTGTETVLYAFGSTLGDGAFPHGSLLRAKNGLLYGMTFGGGNNNSDGTIFSYNIATNTELVLYAFSYNDAVNPIGSLIQTEDSSLYGLVESNLFKYDISTGLLLYYDYPNYSGISYGDLLEVDLPALHITVTSHSPACSSGLGSAGVSATGGNSTYTYLWSNHHTTDTISGLTTGTYLVTVTSGGESAVDSVTITVPNPPQTPIITPSGQTSFCQGDSVILTSSAANTYLWSNHSTTQSITVSNSGNFTVTTFDIHDCPAISSAITVTSNPLPSTPIITQTGNTLTSNATTGNQWFFNSETLSGATSQNYVASQSGTYTVEVTDSNGCSSISSPFNFTLSGIQEIAAEQIFFIVPNPSNGKFKLELGQIEPVEIKIYNSIGEVVFQAKKSTADIDISNQPKGDYFILVQTSESVLCKKLVIQ